MHKTIIINGVPWAIPRGQRTGQWLFNSLPVGAQNALAGALCDPFHRDMTGAEIEAWLDNYTVSDNGEVIAIIYNNRFLWEKG